MVSWNVPVTFPLKFPLRMNDPVSDPPDAKQGVAVVKLRFVTLTAVPLFWLQRRGEHRQESCRPRRDLTKSLHQPLKQSSLRILVAVTDANPPGVLPDLGGHKQKTQPRRPADL